MTVIDAHCDVLSKLLLDPAKDFTDEHSGLDVTLPRLQRANVLLQCFAIWIPEQIESPGINHLLACADLFRTQIIQRGGLRLVRTSDDLLAAAETGRPAALLTIEGADALNGSTGHLRTMFELGARCLGLTWNYANWAADGVMEPRNGGLTVKGRKLVKQCNEIGMIIDVSHLSEAGFWETIGLSDRALIASHSNVRELCDHPRNLTKAQIEAIATKGGVIGINFFPPFLSASERPTIDDVLRHIETVCEWGGERSVGLGSDFDGISRKAVGLESPADYERLKEALAKRYSAELAERILFRNWFEFFVTELPKSECYSRDRSNN